MATKRYEWPGRWRERVMNAFDRKTRAAQRERTAVS
jgi:hypothetical protein